MKFYIFILLLILSLQRIEAWRPIEWLVKKTSDVLSPVEQDSLAEIQPVLHLFSNDRPAAEDQKFCKGLIGYDPTSLPLYKTPEDLKASFAEAALNHNGPIIIVSHGWNGKLCGATAANWRAPLINNLVSNGSPSGRVLFIDWKDGAKATFSNPYAKAAANVRAVGAIVADSLVDLGEIVQEKNKFDASRIHCIGFSLGAHVCSFLCKAFKAHYGQTCGRISGLDPAGARFEGKPSQDRLDSTDAELVDVYHSSTMGINHPIGHADFFLNNYQKKAQPGCSNSFMGAFARCSHSVAAQFYAESIMNRPNKFDCFITDICTCGNDQPVCEDDCILRAGFSSKFIEVKSPRIINITRTERCWTKN